MAGRGAIAVARPEVASLPWGRGGGRLSSGVARERVARGRVQMPPPAAAYHSGEPLDHLVTRVLREQLARLLAAWVSDYLATSAQETDQITGLRSPAAVRAGVAFDPAAHPLLGDQKARPVVASTGFRTNAARDLPSSANRASRSAECWRA